MIPFMTCLHIMIIKGSASNPDGFGSVAFFAVRNIFQTLGDTTGNGAGNREICTREKSLFYTALTKI